MTDPRQTPNPERITQRDASRIGVAIADLNRAPGGRRDRQLIYGEALTVLGHEADAAYVQAAKDGYCGYIANTALSTALQPTHRIAAPATHTYVAADLKSRETASLSFGSLITVTDMSGAFAQTSLGHVPLQHIAPVDAFETDPAAVAEHFLGTPYLWGGNSRWGIDCSGLIQAALLACNIPCPGDSDQQRSLGTAASGPYLRNDLLFWKGHVALVTDTDTLIHANAGSMSTRFETITDAIDRILAAGDGPVVAHRRL